MKRLIITVIVCLFATSAFAQKVTGGSVRPLFSEKYLNVSFDFSKALIDGIPEASLLNIGGERAEDWNKYRQEICSRFTLALYQEIKELLEVGNYPEAAYTLVFIPQSFDDDGDVKGAAQIVGRDGQVIAVISDIDGEAGRFGSFMNLCGDGMTDAGHQVGSCLWFQHKKMLKEAKKAAKKK